MKNDAERVPLSRSHAADAVTMVDPAGAPWSLYRPLTHGKDHGIALSQGFSASVIAGQSTAVKRSVTIAPDLFRVG